MINWKRGGRGRVKGKGEGEGEGRGKVRGKTCKQLDINHLARFLDVINGVISIKYYLKCPAQST